MPILSVDEQDRKLRAECPQFKLVANLGWMGIWEGILRPICQTYRVRIVYFSRRYYDGWTLANPLVSVTVIDPPVGPDPRGTGEPPPHTYRYGHPPAFPHLCIFDPKLHEWTRDEYIVDKIVPWTIKWLFFFEDWLATGEWRGGGRHPEIPAPCLTPDDLDPESRARHERFRSAEFHRLGRKIGAFASCQLMEAASAGSFPPPSWRNLSGVTPADIQSDLTSILLRGPRLVLSLPLAWEPGSMSQHSLISISGEDARRLIALSQAPPYLA
jgi:hypothetical protein